MDLPATSEMLVGVSYVQRTDARSSTNGKTVVRKPFGALKR